MKRITLLRMLLIAAVLLIAGTALAEEPVEGRNGRAELRFLEGMIDHHQMALDMAQDCLTKAESEAMLILCQNIIDAQSAEIATMQGWLLDWYNVAYTPASMAVAPTDDVVAAAPTGGMGSMGDSDAMGGMMGEMGAMRDMMHSMMGHMGEMQGMMGSMMEHMDQMHSMMGQMGEMGGMMGSMGQGPMGAAAESTPEPEATASPDPATVHDHETHTDVPVGAVSGEPDTDPAMTMGMMAGLNRLEGQNYEIAWLESMIDHHGDATHMAERILERAEHDELRTLAEAIIADQTEEITHMEALLAEYEAE